MLFVSLGYHQVRYAIDNFGENNVYEENEYQNQYQQPRQPRNKNDYFPGYAAGPAQINSRMNAGNAHNRFGSRF